MQQQLEFMAQKCLKASGFDSAVFGTKEEPSLLIRDAILPHLFFASIIFTWLQ